MKIMSIKNQLSHTRKDIWFQIRDQFTDKPWDQLWEHLRQHGGDHAWDEIWEQLVVEDHNIEE